VRTTHWTKKYVYMNQVGRKKQTSIREAKIKI